MGDSLAAGFQNFSLVSNQQANSFANVVARQARQAMELPRIAEPGIPSPLRLGGMANPSEPLIVHSACADALISGSPNPQCGTAPPAFPVRESPINQPTNLAVPGMTVNEALTKAPGPLPNPPTAVDVMTNLILGIPGPPLGLSGTQVDQAIALKPSVVLLWIGANDILLAGLSGDFSQLTRIDRFYASFRTLMQRLSSTDARLVVANIPDVTIIPYFTSAQTLAAETGLSLSTVTRKLGMGVGDYLRPGALSIAMEILNNTRMGSLPDTCPATVPGLPFTVVPCILRSHEANRMRVVAVAFNLVIIQQAFQHRAVLIDTYSLLNHIKAKGYVANGQKLNMNYLGGFFTLDAMHPTNTGHAIIANEWIRMINHGLGMNIPTVSIDAIAKADPLVFPK
ncbi:MAG: SGNH/GDSL hydrolase family protein [Bryobacteraceae bacterium]